MSQNPTRETAGRYADAPFTLDFVSRGCRCGCGCQFTLSRVLDSPVSLGGHGVNLLMYEWGALGIVPDGW